MNNWHPHYPDGYPITDGIHNPWVVIDPFSGLTAYRVWLNCRPVSEDDFRRALAEFRRVPGDDPA